MGNLYLGNIPYSIKIVYFYKLLNEYNPRRGFIMEKIEVRKGDYINKRFGFIEVDNLRK